MHGSCVLLTHFPLTASGLGFISVCSLESCSVYNSPHRCEAAVVLGLFQHRNLFGYSGTQWHFPGICILKLFLPLCLEQQSWEAALVEALLLACSWQHSQRSAGAASLPGCSQRHMQLDMTICWMKNCPRLSPLPAPPHVEGHWARVRGMGSLMLWNCRISWTRVIEKWKRSPGGGLGELLEYREGIFCAYLKKLNLFSGHCSRLVAWPERPECSSH